MLTRKYILFISFSTLIFFLMQPLVVVADVQTRLTNLERHFIHLRRTVLEQAYKISKQQKEIQRLQGTIEVLNYQLELIKKSQKTIRLDVEKYLSQKQIPPSPNQPVNSLEKTPSSSPLQTTAPPGIAAKPSPATNDKDKQLYEQIVEQAQAGHSEKAILALKKFLKTSPQSAYADGAHYWLGEMYYLQKRFGLALATFGILLEKYPNSSQSANALLKIGLIYHNNKKDSATARAIFEKVKETYPDTDAARLATQYLGKIQR